jgi:hypothetical protein
MKPQKVICLMPVKNEASVLPQTLAVISEYCDIIIIADQMSTDGSRELYKKFPKVLVIDNVRKGHSNEVRWDLLKKAREFGANNFIICLDADEYIPSTLFRKFYQERDFKVGESFRFPWIQLWKSPGYFNNSGVWYRNYQRIAWVDDGVTEYEQITVVNDHVSRVPQDFLKNNKRIDSVPILHLQWLFLEKTQYKQALYRCSELARFPNTANQINISYAHSLDEGGKVFSKTPQEWIIEYNFNGIDFASGGDKYRDEIFALFDRYGIEYFEPLQVWHIGKLKDEFIRRVGREPISLKNAPLKMWYRAIKNRIKKMIRY